MDVVFSVCFQCHSYYTVHTFVDFNKSSSKERMASEHRFKLKV